MGIFGLVMLLLLFWGINYIKGKDIFAVTHTYYALFDKIDGIKPNTDVEVRGVKIGSVISAEYDPEKSDKILVELNAKSRYKIPDDSRITIYNKMLIAGTVLDLRGLSPEEKERRILEEGMPFLSLAAFPGHVALYLGPYSGGGRDVPVIFHNIWGLRTRPAPGSPEGTPSGRAVIGKAVVTTLRPGSEQAAIASPDSLLDRLTALTILPGNPDRSGSR